MQIVYATCSPRFLEFYLTDKRELVPAGATVFAICTTDRTIENQDEDLFTAITDEEYFTLRSMVNQAELLERQRPRRVENSTENVARRFVSWLFNLVLRKQVGANSVHDSNPSTLYASRKVIPMQQS